VEATYKEMEKMEAEHGQILISQESLLDCNICTDKMRQMTAFTCGHILCMCWEKLPNLTGDQKKSFHV
jgi:hypothetical protein